MSLNPINSSQQTYQESFTRTNSSNNTYDIAQRTISTQDNLSPLPSFSRYGSRSSHASIHASFVQSYISGQSSNFILTSKCDHCVEDIKDYSMIGPCGTYLCNSCCHTYMNSINQGRSKYAKIENIVNHDN